VQPPLLLELEKVVVMAGGWTIEKTNERATANAATTATAQIPFGDDNRKNRQRQIIFGGVPIL
jgi:hypothetical protein